MTDFLAEFYPDEAEPIWLRTFDAKKIPANLKGYVQQIETCRAELATDKALQNKLKVINQKQGIYFVVNAGGNADSDIDRVNAIFCEMDDKTIQEQHDILDYTSPWNTSFRVETRKSVHAYWLLKEPMSNQDFLNLQQGLIKFFKSDASIKNLSRVMRVPLFNHVHYDNGYQYKPITINMFRPHRYTLAELKEAFPYAPPPKQKITWEPQSGRMETLDDVKVELRRRIMEMDSWTAHGKWGCANGKCHNGEGDTGLRIDLVSGTVTCWSDCSLKQILDAFGLELPKKDNRKFEYLPKREQKSDLHRWYQERKNG